jgi:hypothetical protein
MQQYMEMNCALLTAGVCSCHGMIKQKKINSNNSVQFFIIYVPSQQPQGQLQTQRSVDTGNYIMDRQQLQASTGGKSTLIQKSKQTKIRRGNKNMITKNYITQNIRIMNK